MGPGAGGREKPPALEDAFHASDGTVRMIGLLISLPCLPGLKRRSSPFQTTISSWSVALSFADYCGVLVRVRSLPVSLIAGGPTASVVVSTRRAVGEGVSAR